MRDVESPAKIDPASAKATQARSEVTAAKPARIPSRMRRLGPVALVLAACALLAGGGYYAWQTWFANNASTGSVLTAVATRGNLEDTVTATGAS